MIPEEPIPYSAYIFMCLLALCDAEGIVDITWDALSRRLNCSMGDLRIAIDRLMQPDPSSRSEQHEGRRLILLDPDVRDWGWVIVNYQKYRQQRSADDRREYTKTWMQKERAKNKNPDIDQWFEQWWQIYPARQGIRAGKQNALLVFVKVIQSEEDFQQLLRATERYATVQYPKDGERFLRNEYWRDWVPKETGRKEKQDPASFKDKEGRVWQMVDGEWREVKE